MLVRFSKFKKGIFYHDEYQYLNLINNILTDGDLIKGRNGNVISQFGSHMRFSLSSKEKNEDGTVKYKNIIPFLTTKRLAWKTCSKELFWFIRGHTDNSLLKKQNVNIWNDNSTPEFMASRGLSHYPDDILGPIYGWQWRNFNGKYDYRNPNVRDFDIINSYKRVNDYYKREPHYGSKKIDQLQYVIDALKNSDINSTKENKYSRRLIVSAWNPQQLDEMALPPCHILFQFNVNSKDELNCIMYQRSGDVGLGVPFNIASYSLLTHIIAKHCGLKPGAFIYTIGDAHIYEEHIPYLKQQIQRDPFEFPNINIKRTHYDINDYSLDDIEITNYKYHKYHNSIKMDMKV